MLRVWQGVIGAASLGVAALVFRAATGAARIAPNSPSAMRHENVPDVLPAERSQGTRRVVTRRPAHDGAGSGSNTGSRRPGRVRERGGDRTAKRRERTAKANVWTVPHDGGWANKREGAKRVAKIYPTKAAAQAAGRRTAMREKVEHVILKRDGKIAERTNYGGDPARSEGR